MSNRDQKSSAEKVAMANRIARQRRRFEKTYKDVENRVMQLAHLVSTFVDKLLFNPRYGVLVALVLALLLISYGDYQNSQNSMRIGFSTDLKDVKVVVNGNEDAYEYLNVPTTVSVTVSGQNSSDIQQLELNKDYYVEADLRSLSEGTSNVKLQPVNFPSSVNVVIQDNIVAVNVRKRESTKFTVESEFINMNALDSRYVVGTPTYDTTDVIAKASTETLKSISSIKALVDVSGRTEQFTTDATLVAYDQQGNKMSSVTLIPEKVKVTVPITSPNKNVAVNISISGTIPNNKAIESISLDNNFVQIYGPTSVLDQINSIEKIIDAKDITADIPGKIYLLDLPTGVRFASPNKVNVTIRLGNAVSKAIEGVPISSRNNINGYHYVVMNDADITATVNAYGTQTNIDGVSVDNFKSNQYQVYFDMKDLGLGEHDVPLLVYSTNPLLRFEPQKTTIRINVTQ